MAAGPEVENSQAVRRGCQSAANVGATGVRTARRDHRRSSHFDRVVENLKLIANLEQIDHGQQSRTVKVHGEELVCSAIGSVVGTQLPPQEVANESVPPKPNSWNDPSARIAVADAGSEATAKAPRQASNLNFINPPRRFMRANAQPRIN
jgi:hypothetical protein